MTRDGAGNWSARSRGPEVVAGTFYMYRLNCHGTATANAPFGPVLNGNFVLNDRTPIARRRSTIRNSISMGARWRSSPAPEIKALALPILLLGGRHRGVGAASGGR